MTRDNLCRFRHFLLDILQLLPHSKKDAKLDTKSDRAAINEVADLKGTSSVLFFEARKHKDLYLWAAKTPNGPSVKFHVTNSKYAVLNRGLDKQISHQSLRLLLKSYNSKSPTCVCAVHTMAELKLSGNHLKGSRPVLSFDASFDAEPHFQLMKELFTQIFATPKGHHKAKPFFDHVISFSVADGRIWIRNYQVFPDPSGTKSKAQGGSTLVEVGPRACLNPIKVLVGSFFGQVLYDNPRYVSPNAVRSAMKRSAQGKYISKVRNRQHRKEHVAAHPLPRSELDDVFKSTGQ
jgi:ribosome biogenesis protein BRX1